MKPAERAAKHPRSPHREVLRKASAAFSRKLAELTLEEAVPEFATELGRFSRFS